VSRSGAKRYKPSQTGHLRASDRGEVPRHTRYAHEWLLLPTAIIFGPINSGSIRAPRIPHL
jgi:hypothetical protein